MFIPHEFDWRAALAILAVLGTGLISGQMVAIALANAADRGLPEASWTRRFQLENALFTKTMPFALTVPLIALAACCVFVPGVAQPWYIAAATMLAIVLAITMAANVPINNQVASWRSGTAPATWAEVRDRWIKYHWIRTGVGLLSFFCAATATALR